MPESPENSTWPRPLELAVRLFIASVITFWLASNYDRALAETLLPLIGHTVSWLDDHYRIVALTVGAEGADTAVRLRVVIARPIVIAGHVIPADARAWAEVTTTVGTLLQPLLIFLDLLLAWPTRRWQEWPLRLALVAPVAVTLVTVNTPFTLWAYLWDMHVRAYEPDRFSPLLIWSHLLDGGARLLLGALGAMAACIVAANLLRLWQRHTALGIPELHR
jgi:hypothetical protein